MPDTDKNFQDDQVSLGKINTKLDYITRDLDEIKEDLRQDYVRQEQFSPVKTIVYYMVGIILTAVLGALVALVIKK